tara:strand:- start:16065 stop:16391 length:327 start_codon:yes stop_codon:yes gene_type:complete
MPMKYNAKMKGPKSDVLAAFPNNIGKAIQQKIIIPMDLKSSRYALPNPGNINCSNTAHTIFCFGGLFILSLEAMKLNHPKAHILFNLFPIIVFFIYSIHAIMEKIIIQ